MARILAVGPHPDDVEIGMGGTIAALVARGHEVVMCDLTNGEPTPRGTPERRAAEAAEAARILGVGRRITLPLPNRFLTDTVENRMIVAEVIREVRPDLLFIPYWVDAHPDHVAACTLMEAARFYAKLTKTEMRGEPFYPRRVFHFLSSHYRLHVKPAFLFDVSNYMERKLEAIAAYASQFGDASGPLPQSFGETVGAAAGAQGEPEEMWILGALRDENRYWGRLIGRTYAEPFVSREELGLNTLDGVV